MKCGTTTLHEQLAAQPGVFMADPKEPNFFSDDDRFAFGLNWYRGLFSGAPSDAIRGESSTHYTKLPTYPNTIERLSTVCSDVRFVYMIRHPIDRIVSQYVHEWTERNVSVPIDDAIYRYGPLIDYSMYAMQLAPWIERFGHERILLVTLERMRTDPQRFLERVCRFLGYSETPRWDDMQEQSNISAKRMRRSRFRDMIVEAPLLSHVRRMLVPQALRDRIKSLYQMRERPQLSDASQQYLRGRIDPDLARLGRWVGLDLSCDNFGASAGELDFDWQRSSSGVTA